MNKIKKISAVLLTVAVILSLAIPALAVGSQQTDASQPYTYDAKSGTYKIISFSQMGMQSIGGGMFQGAESMTREVIIEDEGITEISDYAFLNCFRLEKVVIPKTVTKISESAFYGCPDSLVIYGEKGSAASKFADEYGYTFKESSSSESKDVEGDISTGIEVTILGVGVVFLILLILCFVLKLFEKIFAQNSTTAVSESIPAPVVPEPAKQPASEEDDTELVAVITAAIAASLNTSTYNLKIKSVKRLASSWKQSARIQNFNNNF